MAAASAVAFATHASALALLLAAVALLAGAATWLDGGPQSCEGDRRHRDARRRRRGRPRAAGADSRRAAGDGDRRRRRGVALGARAGIGVGATAAFVSNFFLGQGLWTPWQMLAWGGCGAVGALLAPLLRRRIPFAVACCVLGFAFGFVLDLWNWYAFYPHTLAAFIARQAAGFPFDVAHASGNLVLALAAGPELRRMLERYGRRLKTEVVWA